MNIGKFFFLPGRADRGDGGGAQSDAVQSALLQQRCIVIRVLSLTWKKRQHLFYYNVPRKANTRIIEAAQEIGHKLSFQEPF